MSILEREDKSKLDDTVSLKCAIQGFVTKDGHTEFVMKVQRGPNTDNTWQVQHRYSDFSALHSALTANLIGYELPLPPKKAFGNMDGVFLQERKIGLQKFIDVLLCNSLFNSHIMVKNFLDPRNYSDKIEETAQEQAAMFFRSEPNWELQERLKDIGWRVRKHFFALKLKDGNKAIKHVLSWVEHGPDMTLEYDSTLLAILRQITTLRHQYIYPTTYASCTDKGATIIRQLHTHGSLRDNLCKAKPGQPRIKKYGNLKVRIPLELPHIKIIGRQVLEALKFMRDKGLPYGNLHAGNVIVNHETGECKLLDIENGILGLPSCYRSFFVQLKSVKDLECIDVYCFGQLLYEITFGNPLDLATLDNFPSHCPPMLQPILHSILSTTATKTGLPTLDDLIANPFFADVTVNYAEKPSFKVNKLKDALKQAKDTIENRLKDEQKKYRQFLRLSKARSELLSDEEKKRRKKSSKKRISTTEDRPKSPPQSSKATTAPPCAPPPPSVGVPPPPPPPPPPSNNTASTKTKRSSQPATSKPPASSAGRGQLLSSISGFKGGLKKTTTNDRSKPKV